MPADPFDDPLAELVGKLPSRTASGGSDTETAAQPPTRRSLRRARAEAAAGPQPADGEPGPERSHSAPAVNTRGRGSAGDAAPGEEAHALAAIFTAEDEPTRAPDPSARRHRRIGTWVVLGIVVAILAAAAGGGLWTWNTYGEQIRDAMGWNGPVDYPAGEATGEALVTISSGDVPSTISRSLYDAGVTKTPEVFYDMLIDSGDEPTFFPGVYTLQLRMTAAAALKALQDPANKMENSALLREGLTVEQTLTTLSESLAIPLEDLQAAASDPAAFGVDAASLEGWLFPAMYTFDAGATPADIISTLVDRTRQALDDAGVPEADRQRVLTIGSIIQREARYTEDFYKVSRVIQNRLDPGNTETAGRLEMDSTVQYGYGEMHDGTVSTSEQARADDNPWNTYMYPGLPAGPIASPGDLAIDAALNPADGPWLFFVTVNLDTGETVFTNTYAEHLLAVEQWQQWCAQNPDSGC